MKKITGIILAVSMLTVVSAHAEQIAATPTDLNGVAGEAYVSEPVSPVIVFSSLRLTTGQKNLAVGEQTTVSLKAEISASNSAELPEFSVSFDMSSIAEWSVTDANDTPYVSLVMSDDALKVVVTAAKVDNGKILIPTADGGYEQLKLQLRVVPFAESADDASIKWTLRDATGTLENKDQVKKIVFSIAEDEPEGDEEAEEQEVITGEEHIEEGTTTEEEIVDQPNDEANGTETTPGESVEDAEETVPETVTVPEKKPTTVHVERTEDKRVQKTATDTDLDEAENEELTENEVDQQEAFDPTLVVLKTGMNKDADEVCIGDEWILTAEIEGLSMVTWSLQWQYTTDGTSWTNAEGETDLSIKIVLDEENAFWQWRYTITVETEG